MKFADYLILTVVLVWFVLAVRSVVKKRGGCSCGGGTSGTCMSCRGKTGCSSHCTCMSCDEKKTVSHSTCCSKEKTDRKQNDVRQKNEEKMKNGN